MSSAVFKAVACGDIKALLKCDDLPNALIMQKETAIHTAVRYKQLEMLDFLLQRYPSLVHEQNTYGDSALHLAVKTRQLHAVLLLVRAVPDLIDVVKNSKNTPLQYACELNLKHHVVAMLAYKPTSINQKGSLGETLLHLAVSWKAKATLTSLLAVCPVSLVCAHDNYLKKTPLNLAATDGQIDFVKLLLNANRTAIDIPDKFGNTPAVNAVKRGHADVFKYLFHVFPHVIHYKDSDPNLLHLARSRKIAQVLLTLKPSFIDDECHNGDSVLHSAIKRSAAVKLISLLIEKKPSLLVHRNEQKQTPLHIASQLGHNHYVNPILASNPNLNDTYEKGNNLLHVAVKAGDSNIIATVFANCRDNLYCVNNEQHTPFCLAIQTKNRNVIELFQPHVTTDMAITAHAQCLQTCDIDLQRQCLQYCSVLNFYMLPELVSIVFQFLGLFKQHKRKRD